MNRTILISAIGILALLLSQAYWLTNMYLDKIAQYTDLIDKSLSYSIDNELILQSGLFGEYNRTNKPKLIIKSADEMTPKKSKAIKEIRSFWNQILHLIREKAFPPFLPKVL